MLPLTTTTKVRPTYLIILALTTWGLAMQERREIEKIPIGEAMELLRKGGIDVGQEEAELIMEFLYRLTMIVISECFDIERFNS